MTCRIAQVCQRELVAGGPGFRLTVEGTNFSNSSVIQWNGVNRPGVLQATTRLTTDIPAASVANPGRFDITVQTPGAALCRAGTITIIPKKNPCSTISQLSPNSGAAGRPGFLLTIVGKDFVTGSEVFWNGTRKRGTLQGTSRLTVQIDANEIKRKGLYQVAVVSPPPGGGVSNVLMFTVK